MNLEMLAKIALGLGTGLLLLGGILYLLAKLGIGSLPGNLVYRGKNVTVYVPIGLMILISVLATLLLNLFRR